MKIKTLKQIKNFKNKRVLVRVDFNVPIKNNQVKDAFKIEQSLPTIEYLVKKGAKVILISHLGRPKTYSPELTLEPAARVCGEFLKQEVKFIGYQSENYFINAKEMTARMLPGQIVLLDNLRFFPGEEDNKISLAKELSGLADIFVLDGFAVAHRAAASVSGVAKILPTYAGLLLEKEIVGLNRVISQPKKPMVVVLGGVKMETKIPVLKKLLPKANQILLGGGIACTYFWAKGYNVGKSLIDKDFKKEALLYGKNKKIILPVDFVIGEPDGSAARVITVEELKKVKKGVIIFDIGPKTIRLFSQYIKKAQTLVWNGAVGYFEQHPYEYGTKAIARLLASRARGRAFGVCGGGETVEVLRALNMLVDIDLVSTGGGAMLEFLSGKKLHGVQAVTKK